MFFKAAIQISNSYFSDTLNKINVFENILIDIKKNVKFLVS